MEALKSPVCTHTYVETIIHIDTWSGSHNVKAFVCDRCGKTKLRPRRSLPKPDRLSKAT